MFYTLKNHIEVSYPNTYNSLYIKNDILYCKFNDRFCASHFLDATLNLTAGNGSRVRDHIKVKRDFLSADIQVKKRK